MPTPNGRYQLRRATLAEPYPDIRAILTKNAEQLRQKAHCQGPKQTNLDTPFNSRLTPRRRESRVNLAYAETRCLNEEDANLSKFYPRVVPIKQPRANQFFDFSDTTTDR